MFNNTIRSVKGWIFMVILLVGFAGLVYVSSSPGHPDPPDVGFQYLSNGTVIHLYNEKDDYYIDSENGIQITNHFENYWDKNVLCVGYLDVSDQWNVIYCVDDLSDFVKKATTDNMTYTNYSLRKNLTYLSFNFEVGLTWSLVSNATKIKADVFFHNTGIPVPNQIGFAWVAKDIRIGGDYPNDWITLRHANNSIQQYNLSNPNENFRFVQSDLYAGFYFLEDMVSNPHSTLLLEWDFSIPFILQSLPQMGQYNNRVVLAQKIGTFGTGEQKGLTFYWYDAICGISCTGTASVTEIVLTTQNLIGIEPENNQTSGNLMRCRVDTDCTTNGNPPVAGCCTLDSGCVVKFQHLVGATYTTIPQRTAVTDMKINITLNLNPEPTAPNTDADINRLIKCNENYTSEVRCQFNDPATHLSSTSNVQCTDTRNPVWSVNNTQDKEPYHVGDDLTANVLWFDNGTLKTAILSVNLGNGYINVSQISIDYDTATWVNNSNTANMTFTTSGVIGNRACWIQYVTDTNNNWNMTTEQCVTLYRNSAIIINATGGIIINRTGGFVI